MAIKLTDEQKEKVKALLLAEPCLFNARHYLNHSHHQEHSLQTMSNWLNEVLGAQTFELADVAAILIEPKKPETALPEISPEGGNKGEWDVQAAILKDALGSGAKG